MISAFDALSDTTHFITFSGATGLELSWDVSQSRGQELSSTHDGVAGAAVSGSFGFGANIGRRRLEATDKGVPGYAYPTTGKVLAVSKKLLEVTPEALEERRRSLAEKEVARRRLPATETAGGQGTEDGKTDPGDILENPCRRRLDGTKMTDEEHRRLGVTACVDFNGGTSTSFSVSLGRAINKEAEHTHSVAISLKDGNVQDVFAVKISQDAVYGTPIFTTMGGRSSCPGETGTTRRDSRVTIKEIKPLCVSDEDVQRRASDSVALCSSMLSCECEDLEPGQDAIFSVVLENLSPWVTSGGYSYVLRAANGASMPWDSGKYARDFYLDSRVGCEPGDLGSLEITALGNKNLRDGNGIDIAPLPYGQSEVHIRVSRRDYAPQCFSYSELELELVSVCEDTDDDSNQEVYQYQATMDSDPTSSSYGDVSVVHPKFVGRPVGEACAEGVTLNAATTSGTTHYNDKGWCYSDLNRAVGCTESPKTCWE